MNFDDLLLLAQHYGQPIPFATGAAAVAPLDMTPQSSILERQRRPRRA